MTIRILGFFAIAALVTACSGGGPTRTSGFIKDYSKLKSDPNRNANWVWIKPGSDLRMYDRLMIDPIIVMPDSESRAGELGPETLAKVAKAFRKILVRTIDPYYTVVFTKAPNVLRVSIAVTDVKPATVGSDGKRLADGEAAIEVIVRDSVTGEELGLAIDREKGSLAGTTDVPREWRHVEGAFIEWANALLDYVDTHRT